MNEFTLYAKNGTALFDIVPETSSSHEWVLMSENRLSLTFELEQCVNLSPGCYIDFDGVRYYLLEEYKPQMVNSTAWKYNVNLFDAASWMSVTLALNLLDGKNTPIFNYTAPALEHAQIIVANLNRRMGTTAWKVGSIIKTGNIAIEYRAKYCSDVLQEIVDDQNTEWWLDGMTLNIGRAEFGDAVELGYGNGLLGDIVCEQADNMRTYAYLCPIGSTRNIDPTKYGFERLQLPNGQTLVPMNLEQGIGELAEEKAFSKIFPRYEGTVQSVRSRPAKGDDGREFTIYYIGDTLPFNPNDYEIAGLVKKITFLSDPLMGQDFEVTYDPEAQEFEIITQWPNGGEAQLPGGLLTPEVGDKYVVWNITMPDVYYTLASQEFLEAAEAFAAEAIQDVSIYKAPLDYIEVQERGLRLRPGQRVRLLSDVYFASGYYDSRITRITRKVLFPDAPNIDVSAVRATGTISRLQAAVQKSETQIAQLSGALPTVVKSGEDTSASDSSVYTSAKSEREFLNRRKGGSVLSPVDFIAAPRFPAGADFNGAVVRFDSEHKCWVFPYNVLVEGGVAWNTKLEGFEAKTITAAVNVDWKTIGKNENGELYVIGGTGGGVADSVAWGNVTGKPNSISGYGITDAYTKTEVANAITTAFNDFASKVSNDGIVNTYKELIDYAATHGAEFTTLVGVVNNKADKSSIPTALSQLNNDKGYITGITSSMITTALGYTPYNAANFTKDNIKSTLGISDWALSSASPFADSGKITSATDLTSLKTGIGYTQGYTPVEGAYEYGQIINFNGTKSFTQIYISDDTSTGGAIYFRTDWNKTGLANRTWREVLTSKSYAKYALPITGGTIGGALTVNSTIACDSAIRSTEFLRVNTKDSTRTYAYIRAEIGSSLDKNVALAHIGACYGYGNDLTLTNAYDAIAMYRSVVGVGGTFTYDELYANQKNGISLAVKGALSIDGSPKISYDSTKNALILPFNLVVEGGVAWNTKLDGFEAKTITAAVNVDGSTLSKTSSGALCIATDLMDRIVALENKLNS